MIGKGQRSNGWRAPPFCALGIEKGVVSETAWARVDGPDVASESAPRSNGCGRDACVLGKTKAFSLETVRAGVAGVTDGQLSSSNGPGRSWDDRWRSNGDEAKRVGAVSEAASGRANGVMSRV
ncbi:low specificity L-threonine aldolase [Sesbania bispinosa]|nr:low specificity L-threonine aldolase [Sesbania bispinosa]